MSFVDLGLLYQSFGLLDMFMSEKELAVEITEVDSIEIDDMNFAKTSEDKIFQ